MTDLKELAVAYWRLKKWVDERSTEKKLAAESSLRIMEEYLTSNGISVVDLTNQIYDAGLAAEIIFCENPEVPCENPVITETLRPIILQNNAVALNGQIVISQPLIVSESKPKKAGRKPSAKSAAKKEPAPKKPRKSSSKKKANDENGQIL